MAEINGKHAPVLEWAKAHERETVELIRQMVERESPSDEPGALQAFRGLVLTNGRAGFRRARGNGRGRAPAVPFCDGQDASAEPVLVLGHYDTVWPTGTLQSMPFREQDGRLWGPGVLDMKGGVAAALMALRAVKELNLPARRGVLLQLNADEEIGSHTSRALTEENAKNSRAVLVVEPGTGLSGKLKTARKGVGDYRLQVNGRAAHAGVDFRSGASAILELSRQLLTIAEFTDEVRGVTVNPGVIAGGTRGNVIAAEAHAVVDVRVSRMSDAAVLDRKFHALRAVDPRCSLVIKGGLNRPPMERTQGIQELFAMAQGLARQVDIELEESATGGGSDGNFTAALGVPTLDGIGMVGEGAHAAHESILIDRIADRTALLALLLAAL